MVQYLRIGELLLSRGLITKRQLHAALKLQIKSGLRFGEVLVASGTITEDQIAQCLAEQYNYPLVDPDSLAPEPEALALFDRGFALSHQVLPSRVSDGVLECVISDPIDVALTDTIAWRSHLPLRLMIAPPTRLLAAIERAYRAESGTAGERDKRAAAPAPTKRRPLRRITQRDREALLTELAFQSLPTSRKNLWQAKRSA